MKISEYITESIVKTLQYVLAGWWIGNILPPYPIEIDSMDITFTIIILVIQVFYFSKKMRH